MAALVDFGRHSQMSRFSIRKMYAINFARLLLLFPSVTNPISHQPKAIVNNHLHHSELMSFDLSDTHLCTEVLAWLEDEAAKRKACLGLPVAFLSSPVLSVHSAVCGSACGLFPEAVRGRRGRRREGGGHVSVHHSTTRRLSAACTHCILSGNSSIVLLWRREKYKDPYFFKGQECLSVLDMFCNYRSPCRWSWNYSASDLISIKDASIPLFCTEYESLVWLIVVKIGILEAFINQRHDGTQQQYLCRCIPNKHKMS